MSSMNCRLLNIVLLVMVLFLEVSGVRQQLTEDDEATCDNEDVAVAHTVQKQRVFRNAKSLDGSLLNGTAVTNPYTSIVAASAPVATSCSFYQEHKKEMPGKWADLAHLCGPTGKRDSSEAKVSLNTHIDKVWGLIKTAHEGNFANYIGKNFVLKTVIMPEWTFRRYPEKGKQHAEPFSYAEVKYIIQKLEEKMSHGNFAHVLVAPGTVFWGITDVDGKFAVFNSLLIFLNGKFVHHHNKFHKADYIDEHGASPREKWGIDELRSHKSKKPGCTEVTPDTYCGRAEWISALKTKNLKDSATALKEFGLVKATDVLIINGLAVGVDICLDHRMQWSGAAAIDRLNKIAQISEYDIQFLFSSGMALDTPEEDGDENGATALMLRDGGVAISTDGINSPWDGSRMYTMKTGHRFYDEGIGLVTTSAARYENIQWYTAPSGEQVRKVSVYDDCEMNQDWELVNSWQPDAEHIIDSSQCNSDAMCLKCAVRSMAGELECQCQFGNWKLLRMWRDPVALNPPDAQVTSWLDETDAEDLIM